MVRDRFLLLLGSEYEMGTKLLTAKAVMEEELGETFTGTLNVSVLGKAYTREVPLSTLADAQYLAIMDSGM